MSVTKRSIILAILFAVLSCSVYFYTLKFKQKDPTSFSSLPTFIASDSVGTLFDETGKISKKMIATSTEYYDKQNLYIFDNPLLTSFVYQKNGEANTWHMKGQKGRLTVDDNAVITGNVILYPGFKDPVIDRATASVLVYTFDNNDVTSQELVNIYGHEFMTQGTHFKYDLDTNVLSYKGQPHATFYPNSK